MQLFFIDHTVNEKFSVGVMFVARDSIHSSTYLSSHNSYFEMQKNV